MPDESPIDLDEYAEAIAEVVAKGSADERAARTAERMEEERWRRRSQKHTGC
jgi:hypothetical protein